MIQTAAIVNKLSTIPSTMHIADFIDILIIALLIYTLFLFLRRAKTYLVFWGIGIAFVLYVVSKTFDLYLTFVTLRYFAGISVILFVIIFQSEIRKYIEILGLIGSRQFKVGSAPQKSPTISVIVQACVQMAQDKTGALIVLQADNNIANFSEGGIPLDSLISEELIMSIFDHHSSGHDGAMIINNNRITKFGVQLPLSTNFKEIGKHGTRHSAALGLTEVSDSLCIICSEEKGTISIAKDGKLKTPISYDKLEKELEKYASAQRTKPENFFAHFFQHNLTLKVLALVFSIVICIFAKYRQL